MSISTVSTVKFKCMSNVLMLVILVLICHRCTVFSQTVYRWMCDRVPEDVSKEPQIGDGGYEIKLLPINSTNMVYRYQLGQQYRIIIANRYPGVTFTNFYLTTVPEHVTVRSEYMNTVGEFHHLVNPPRTRTMDSCPGVVTGINKIGNSKLSRLNHVEVQWTAPYDTTPCVAFRATVEYYPGEYFKDQGMLTKIICPSYDNVALRKTSLPQHQSDAAASDEVKEEMVSMKRKHINECCACGNAIYKLEVKGRWTRQHHPNQFPDDAHQTHWTSIIGATHSRDYSIYFVGGKAKEAVKSVCTIGDTTGLEKEFKEKGRWNILNVIKTHGLWGEGSLADTRTALFSVNRTHHLLSFVSMLGPSPDWCAGVDDLDTCDSTCTWKKHLQIPLYAWDAGSKKGNTYMPNKTADEKDYIKYIGDGLIYKDGPLKLQSDGKAEPVAELLVTRTRPVQDWVCEHKGLPPNNADQPQREGRRKRPRRPEPQWKQDVRQQERSMIDTYPDMIKKKMRMKCLVSPWETWNQCSVTCGTSGVRRRQRRLETNLMEGECEKLYHLNETETCTPVERNCQYKKCETTMWSQWSSCIAECNGNGEQERFRALYTPEKCPMNKQKEIRIREMRGCYRSCNAKQICIKAYDSGMDCTGGEGTFYYYFIKARKCLPFKYKGCKGNDNKFQSEKKCYDFCKSGLNDVSERDEQTMARIQETNMMVNRGLTEPCRQISDSGFSCHDNIGPQIKWYFDQDKRRCVHFSYNGCGGNDNRFKSRMECQRRCSHLRRNVGEVRDCLMSTWGPWGPCSNPCSGKRSRQRRILREPENGGAVCPTKTEESMCPACCDYSQWSSWSRCSRTCNFMGLPSIRERRRHRLTPDQIQCTGKRMVERTECREYRNVACL